ncbi:hypothetical protein [Klebsiella pneumoniae IS33]|nr:hypothetical protein [Klebsiella pneumoniae IS33]
MNALFLRARKTVCTALVLGLSSPALADLPTVEGPKSKTDGTFYGKIAGYINDGLVLGGLVVAAVAFIVVAMSCVSTLPKSGMARRLGASLVPWWPWVWY